MLLFNLSTSVIFGPNVTFITPTGRKIKRGEGEEREIESGERQERYIDIAKFDRYKQLD